MAIAMPKILIEFKKLAETLSTRSALGATVLLMRDTTAEDAVSSYTTAAEAQADSAKYTTSNAQYIQDAFGGGAATVHVVRIGNAIDTALAAVLAHALTGWITVCDGTEADFTALTAWIAVREGEKQPLYNGIVFNTAKPNCKHVVNFITESVTFADSRGTCDGDSFLPTLAGILASCGVNSSCTYYKCTMLTAASATEGQDAALAEGKLFLFADGKDIRIARGINSLTDDDDDDFKFIDTVAVMDLIQSDIMSLWKENYAGKYRNTLDNQMLFISAVNSYFQGLVSEGILDNEADNTAQIDVTAQRQAWVSAGKTEAGQWTDEVVKVKTFRRDMFLTGSIRICGTMDNLTFPITLQ
ncbi:MAG: phage tail sheath C-terminal domain-containing protein [Eubacteriales bacterium]|nr:phage tail sheath C-terminal domain-containing protein [Eubacteriales bacterium]